jgi:receptor expression-enhancing protein 5/6
MASCSLPLAVIVAVFGLIFFWIAGISFLATFLGTVVPSYQSFKAIESSKKEDDTKWLTYWVVFAHFQLLESFSGFIMYWIPFYQW